MLATLSVWANTCFNNLPEDPSMRTHTAGLDFEELQHLFDAFDQEATVRLRDASQWLDGKVPEAVTRTLDSGPGWNIDLTSPFVRRIEVEIGDTIIMIGDLHGSIHSLLRNLLRLKHMGMLSDSWKIMQSSVSFLFLGDLVDRGSYGVEVWATVMRLYAANPDNIMVVRGNHEERGTWQAYTFLQELNQKFPKHILALKMFTVFCERLPHAIYMAHDPHEEAPETESVRDNLMNTEQISLRMVTSDPLLEHVTSDVFTEESESQSTNVGTEKAKKKGKGKGIQYRGKNAGGQMKKMKRPQINWRVQNAQQIMDHVSSAPPLKGEWVQCCHGGIEPRFNPRPLLQSTCQFSTTGPGHPWFEGRTYEGLNWSDWTGINHVAKERFSSTDPRGGKSGFLVDIPDTSFYSEHVGIKAFFRGHQDTHCCFKLVVQGLSEVVEWERLLGCGDDACTIDTLATEGIPLRRFLKATDTVPVFTFSTCAEARTLRDEGFGLVTVRSSLPEWSIRQCIYPIQWANCNGENWVVAGCSETGEPKFSWQGVHRSAFSKNEARYKSSETGKEGSCLLPSFNS